MPSNTKFKPQSKLDYSSDNLNTNLKGVLFSANFGTDTIYDYCVSEDNLIDGASVHCINSSLGDKITFQVVDKDNILGFGENTILGQYMTDWYINPNITEQLSYISEYPAKIYTGLYVRIIYTSVGSVNVDVIVNFRLHKILW